MTTSHYGTFSARDPFCPGRRGGSASSRCTASMPFDLAVFAARFDRVDTLLGRGSVPWRYHRRYSRGASRGLDDARLDVALIAAGGCTPTTRTPGGRRRTERVGAAVAGLPL